jgi:hypothetical protein
MVNMQLTYDALRVLRYDAGAAAAMAHEMASLQALADERKLIQGLFIARRG